MKFIPRAAKRGRPIGAKAGFTSQLSELQKLILLYMLSVEQALKESPDEEIQVEIKNRGIPWNPSEFLEAWWMPWIWHAEAKPTGPSAPALSRALHRLEDRELITAQAEGRGRNRRITHLKFSAPARGVAVNEQERQIALWPVEKAMIHMIKKYGSVTDAEDIQVVLALLANKYGSEKALEMYEAGLRKESLSQPVNR